MMKKTLIAAGVAVAMTVPAIASADVSLTANLQAEVFNLSGNGARANGKGWYMADSMTNGNLNAGNWSAINLRASHDLGNGLNAFGHVSMNIDPSNVHNKATRESLVGLGGDWGKMQLGRMASPYTTAGKDPLNATFMQARGNGGRIGGFGGFGNGDYVDSAIQYHGKFGPVSLVAGVALDSSSKTVTGDAETNAEHSYGVRVNVDLDVVEVWVAHNQVDDYNNDTGDAGFVSDDTTLTKVGVQWKGGPFGVVAEYETVKDESTTGGVKSYGGNAGDFLWAAGTYRMGANTFMLGLGQFDADNNNRDQTYMAAGVRHAFSRQVSAHAGVRQTKRETGGTAPGDVGTGDRKETAVGAGMRVTF